MDSRKEREMKGKRVVRVWNEEMKEEKTNETFRKKEERGENFKA